MAIRLRMRRGSEELVLKALVSSGYETAEPEILLPLEMAEKLNLIPKLPEGSEVKEYSLADGSSTKLIRIPKAAKASVVEEDRAVGEVDVDVVVSERAEEALISSPARSEESLSTSPKAFGVSRTRSEGCLGGRIERRI